MSADEMTPEWVLDLQKEMLAVRHENAEQRWHVFNKWADRVCGDLRAGKLNGDYDYVAAFRDVASAQPGATYEAVDASDACQRVFEKVAKAARDGPDHELITLGDKKLVLVNPARRTAKNVEWLWEGHLALGMISLLSGPPDMGKSQEQAHNIKCTVMGCPWPGQPHNTPWREPRNVVMLVAEDSLEHTVIPRLLAVGIPSDVIDARIRIIEGIRYDKKGRAFLLQQDIDVLELAIAQRQAALLTIDPVISYLGGKADAHKAVDVRNQLSPLKDVAERQHCAISMLTHPAKAAGSKALDQFIGSQAFVAIARIADIVVLEKDLEGNETGRKLLCQAKNNVHVKMPTLAFTIQSETIINAEGERIETSRVVFDNEPVNITADEALAEKRQDGAQTREAKELLLDMLDSGRKEVNELKDAAKGHGISWPTIERAKKALAAKGIVIKAIREGIGGTKSGKWFWEMQKATVTPIRKVWDKDDENPPGD
jgi:RecA-family ATPase